MSTSHSSHRRGRPPLPEDAMQAKILERILAKRFIAITGCWEWTGPLTNKGYGHIIVRIGFGNRKANRGVHRIAYSLLVSPIPQGVCVLHKCDNPKCFNPDHLFLGTQSDNIRDMHNKCRWAQLSSRKGEGNGHSRLTLMQVNEIRTRYTSGSISQCSLAAEYGVSQAHISRIVLRMAWSHEDVAEV